MAQKTYLRERILDKPAQLFQGQGPGALSSACFSQITMAEDKFLFSMHFNMISRNLNGHMFSMR